MKKLTLAIALAIITPLVAHAAKPPITTDVPLDSPYYEYIDKLEAMGYLESIPAGAKPYSRAKMAQMTVEVRDKAQKQPLPLYLQAYLSELEQGLAKEIVAVTGGEYQTAFNLRELHLQTVFSSQAQRSYEYKSIFGLKGSWQPFSSNNNGYRYGSGANLIADLQMDFNAGADLALSITPRFHYDKDQEGKASLVDAYAKTRVGNLGIQLGKTPLKWGQGASGTLNINNNAIPMTMIKLNMVEPIGLFGGTNLNLFYARLEGNRMEIGNGLDFNNAGLLGIRVDITPARNFTMGLTRVSMLGGDGNGLSRTDWNNWITGKNATSNDKWNDRAGVDFRWRLLGVQFYGEATGEDQAGHVPSHLDYRAGIYLPQLSKDGSWDLLAEYAKTSTDGYRHAYFRLGWTYNGNIIGDAMGVDARKLYLRVQKHFGKLEKIALHSTFTEYSRNMANSPQAWEISLDYDRKLASNLYMNAMVGYSRLKNANFQSGHSDSSKILALGLRMTY